MLLFIKSLGERVDGNGKNKNLVLFHLESISNTILWQYRVELDTIWRLMQSSRSFTRFDVTATSTYMSVVSIITGDTSTNDTMTRYKFVDPFFASGGNVITDLEKRGYAHARFYYDALNLEPVSQNTVISRSVEHVFSQVNAFLRECREKKQNFFLGFYDYITHMTYEDQRKFTAKTFSERFRIAYQLLNATTGEVLKALTQHGLWEDTVVACYGDHGDELWSHSFKNGRCHTIDPYASATRVPFFVYDHNAHRGFDDSVLSATDVRSTLMQTVFPDDPAAAGPVSGFDVIEKRDGFSFAQTLYALQGEYNDPEKSITKGYAVTDGILRLVVGSGGCEPADAGMELFYDRHDPTNSRNLLDFYTLDEEGDIVGLADTGLAADSEMAFALNEEETAYLRERLKVLRQELRGWVRAKETRALESEPEEYYLMPEEAFRTARKRIRSDYHVHPVEKDS